ncbi:hypothetical protein [Palleronia sp.]|uniref:hypothetical protein n=1 Tax=Palleronia sp. TaxID=1940284 RepID=UPI0035C8012D
MIGVRSLGQALGLAILLASGATVASAQVTKIPPDGARIIDAHGECRSVRNLMSDPVMVPHRNRSEWWLGANAFLAKKRDGLRINSCDFQFQDVADNAASRTTCTVTFEGDVMCMGREHPFTDNWSASMKKVAGLPAMRSVAVTGTGYHCGVSTADDVWCWGTYGSYKGKGWVKTYPPMKMRGLSQVDRVFAEELGTPGRYTPEFCAIKVNGSLWCWMDWRAADDGLSQYRDPYGPEHRLEQIDAGSVVRMSHHQGGGCYQKANGDFWCFGRGKFAPKKANWFPKSGPMTDGLHLENYTTYFYDDHPETMGFGGCVVRSNGELWCFGNQRNGSKGSDRSFNYMTRGGTDTTNAAWLRPVRMTKFPGTQKLISPVLHGTCAVNTEDKIHCYNHYTKDSIEPVWGASIGREIVKIIGRPGDHGYYVGGICVLDADGGLWCAGQNQYGQHGGADGKPFSTLTQVKR